MFDLKEYMKQIKKTYADKEGRELAAICAHIALETKAEDVIVLDVQGLASFTDYFVIMSGRSTRHVQALAEALEEEIGTKRLSVKNSEGLREGQWVLLDFGDVVIHVFYHESRSFYDLEGLWHDATSLPVPELLVEYSLAQ